MPIKVETFSPIPPSSTLFSLPHQYWDLNLGPHILYKCQINDLYPQPRFLAYLKFGGLSGTCL